MQHDALQIGLVVAALVAALRRLVKVVGAQRDDLGVQPGLERVDVAGGKRISRCCRGRNVLRKVFRMQGGRGVWHRRRQVELGSLGCTRRDRGGRFLGFFLAHGGSWLMCIAMWTFGWALLFKGRVPDLDLLDKVYDRFLHGMLLMCHTQDMQAPAFNTQLKQTTMAFCF